MSRVVYKYEIPIDGKAHEVPDGRIVLADPLVLVRPLSMLGMDEQTDPNKALIWIEHQTSDLDTVLFTTARELFRRAWDRKQNVRLLGIAAGSLGAAPAQLSLLDAAQQERKEKLARATDELRQRLGPDAVQTARTLLRKPSVESVNDRPPLPAFTKRK